MTTTTPQTPPDAAEAATPPEPTTTEPLPLGAAPCSPLEWRTTPEHHQRQLLGHLRGHPEITLYIITLCDDRDDRGAMSGAFIPDEMEGADFLGPRALISGLRGLAHAWFLEFMEKANGLTANVTDQATARK